jgi:hypothetical protein
MKSRLPHIRTEQMLFNNNNNNNNNNNSDDNNNSNGKSICNDVQYTHHLR